MLQLTPAAWATHSRASDFLVPQPTNSFMDGANRPDSFYFSPKWAFRGFSEKT
jgi:hypothetical protein